MVATSDGGAAYGYDSTFTTPTSTPSFAFAIGSVGSGNGQFSAPSEVAIDGAGNIWVVDIGNNRVQKFNSKGEYLSQFGNSEFRQRPVQTPSASRPTPKATFGSPIPTTTASRSSTPKANTCSSSARPAPATANSAVPRHRRRLRRQRLGRRSGNHRIQKFNSKGEYLPKFGSREAATASSTLPAALRSTPKGNVWVADYGNHRVQKFNSEGEFLSNSARREAATASSIPQASPSIVKGNIWVADYENNRIEKFNSKGEYLTQFGTKGSGAGQFQGPRGIAFDSAGEFGLPTTKTTASISGTNCVAGNVAGIWWGHSTQKLVY